MFWTGDLVVRTGDPVRAVSVFCRTCPFAVARADDGMAERHARNNPGHDVNKIVTVSFTTRLHAAVPSTVK